LSTFAAIVNVPRMKMQIYQLLHVFSVIMIFGVTFFALAAPKPERKRGVLIATGILGLVILVSGFGLISTVYSNQFAGWMIVKMVVWLLVAGLGGMAFRKPKLAGPLGVLFAVLALIAVIMVYFKPF
jgi:hypothetical protein